MQIRISNGHTIEINIDEVGVAHRTIGDNIKYYIQIIENNYIKELEISKETYYEILRWK